MCGISRIYSPKAASVSPAAVRNMLQQIQYRGPDESGIYIGQGVGLGSVRLSIIDLAQGQQPMSDEAGEFWIVFNGEIFNYIELREELIRLGYHFRTTSDTEVLLLLFKHYSEKCLEKLNGQFAFAIWDTRKKELFLGRDRVGIRPLFYYREGADFVFGSEIKCLMESGLVKAEPDPESLNRVFTFWSIPSPGTMFKGVKELPPGHYMVVREHDTEIRPFWELRFRGDPGAGGSVSLSDSMEEFEALISDSVRLRLRADVPVAAYLSGGIDSSATTWLIKQIEPGVLNTFSLGFESAEFDETSFQQKVARQLETTHHSITCKDSDVADNFSQVLWHTEIPILRTGAVPMYLLSGLVNEHGIKVVITGEGADEFLGGYNIFKEAIIREFWSREPSSKIRPLLLQKLYPYLAQFQGRNSTLQKMFFGHALAETGSPVYSHLIRWNNSKHIREHLSKEFLNGSPDPVDSFISSLPEGFGELDLLSRAQWIESTLFLSGYLLSSQGDRMGMAHSVEGRYPFLDHRVIEFATRLPWNHKIRGLNEKYLMKKLMDGRLPGEVVHRPKQAYRAPVASSLTSSRAPGYLREVVTPGMLRKFGIFNPASVEKLLGKMEEGKTVTENENMAVAGILSTQILMDMFVSGNKPYRETEMRVKCPVSYDKFLKK
ncbi:MAG: asparagine synthase (glutamine-hydrolyzing) [Bacteroidales bacterium]|nr:asparagine synthase (glutamine-hydrolyzing) [Bacteroidales bacterium]